MFATTGRGMHPLAGYNLHNEDYMHSCTLYILYDVIEIIDTVVLEYSLQLSIYTITGDYKMVYA